MIHAETAVEPPWPAADWEELAQRAVRAGTDASPYGFIATARYTAEVSVRLSSDDEVRTLNRQYRQKDRPTNVLSFPMVQGDLIEALADTDDGEVLLGDIVLAHGVAAQEAADKDIPLADHVTHLIVHGVLHLLGYDHEGGEPEAEGMEDMERAALATLGLPDPYGDRHAAAGDA